MGATALSQQEITDLKAVEDLKAARAALFAEIGKVIIGQEKVIEEVLYALFARGHCLLIGVPGLGKTLLVNTLARLLNLDFNRIQFTPDLMPSDITGTEILEEDKVTKERRFKFVRGPVFANVLLADEINRTPPKTQAALLQAMQEYQVTSAGQTYPLEMPFFVLATQNPIEQEGTYPLPEAQLDRLMFNVRLEYPTFDEEVTMVKATTGGVAADVKAVVTRERIKELQELVRKVPVADHVVRYAVDLVKATRPNLPTAFDMVKDYVSWGAGPRASQYLILGGKARALLRGRTCVAPEDIRALAYAVLRHRVVVNFNAEAEGITADTIIERLLAQVSEPSPSR